jgi:Protein of unknown function (DUF2971)
VLSQWRRYGAGESGYSLGIDLRTVGTQFLPPNTYLRRVIYDDTSQRQEVQEVVETWLRTGEQLLEPKRGFRPEDVSLAAIDALRVALAEHHLCFKNPGFAEEREWRLVRFVNVRAEVRRMNEERLDAARERMRQIGVDMPEIYRTEREANTEEVEIRFRPSRIGLVPYVEIPLIDQWPVFTGRLPLEKVIQGPTPNPKAALESLTMYLESVGYGHYTDVTASRIPLREMRT